MVSVYGRRWRGWRGCCSCTHRRSGCNRGSGFTGWVCRTCFCGPSAGRRLRPNRRPRNTGRLFGRILNLFEPFGPSKDPPRYVQE